MKAEWSIWKGEAKVGWFGQPSVYWIQVDQSDLLLQIYQVAKARGFLLLQGSILAAHHRPILNSKLNTKTQTLKPVWGIVNFFGPQTKLSSAICHRDPTAAIAVSTLNSLEEGIVYNSQ